MKKIAKILTALLAVCVLALGFAFAGCEDGNGNSLSGEMRIVVTDGENEKVYTVDLSNYTESSSVENVIVDLSTSDDLYYKGTTSKYGLYLTEMGTTKQLYNSEYESYYEKQTPIIAEDGSTFTYIFVYTSVTEIDGVSYSDASYGTYTYETADGTQTLNSASYGVSGLPCVDGAVYLFTVGTYSY